MDLRFMSCLRGRRLGNSLGPRPAGRGPRPFTPAERALKLPLQVHAITARPSPASKATQQGRIEKGIALVFQVSPPQAERELADGNAGALLQAEPSDEQAIVVRSEERRV